MATGRGLQRNGQRRREARIIRKKEVFGKKNCSGSRETKMEGINSACARGKCQKDELDHEGNLRI